MLNYNCHAVLVTLKSHGDELKSMLLPLLVKSCPRIPVRPFSEPHEYANSLIGFVSLLRVCHCASDSVVTAPVTS